MKTSKNLNFNKIKASSDNYSIELSDVISIPSITSTNDDRFHYIINHQFSPSNYSKTPTVAPNDNNTKSNTM
jgi:hypothetical protein